MSKIFAIGIDLGTSNCAIALTKLDQVQGAQPTSLNQTVLEPPTISEIAQVVRAGQIASLPLLPSALYLLQEHERESQEFQLPWEEIPARYLVGAGARDMATSLPERVVTSVKSWLCSDRIDRRSPVLPWESSSFLSESQESTLEKLSPLQVTTLYLEHLRSSLTEAVATGLPEGIPLSDCEVTITVPASFDEVARSLTLEAVRAAGFNEVTLLEEPLAAFYAWLAIQQKTWRKEISPGDIVLVCDVGGGTADFSLIAVTEQNGNLELERISVGEHVLLGGENMDLALAYRCQARLADEEQELDAWQFQTLVHLCRTAKERLLSDPALKSFPLSIPNRGASLFASGISTAITQADITLVVLDGFFPEVSVTATPSRGRASGLKEVGLSYATDAALTKHLAHFLCFSLQLVKDNSTSLSPSVKALCEGQETQFAPSAVLFNGGVFNSTQLRDRIISQLQVWSSNKPVKELTGIDRDTAVAVGAASYARSKVHGDGFRIKSGTTRTYYVGIESSAPAVPGLVHPVKGVCVLPLGTEEGSDFSVGDVSFSLHTGEESEFRLFSSTERPNDAVGSVMKDAEKSLYESALLTVTIPPLELGKQELLNVTLHSKITEIGVLEVWMHHTNSEAKWKLEFNVRPQGDEQERI
jgi:hypothetical protein